MTILDDILKIEALKNRPSMTLPRTMPTIDDVLQSTSVGISNPDPKSRAGGGVTTGQPSDDVIARAKKIGKHITENSDDILAAINKSISQARRSNFGAPSLPFMVPTAVSNLTLRNQGFDDFGFPTQTSVWDQPANLTTDNPLVYPANNENTVAGIRNRPTLSFVPGSGSADIPSINKGTTVEDLEDIFMPKGFPLLEAGRGGVQINNPIGNIIQKGKQGIGGIGDIIGAGGTSQQSPNVVIPQKPIDTSKVINTKPVVKNGEQIGTIFIPDIDDILSGGIPPTNQDSGGSGNVGGGDNTPSVPKTGDDGSDFSWSDILNFPIFGSGGGNNATGDSIVPNEDKSWWQDFLSGLAGKSSSSTAASNIGDILRGGIQTSIEFKGNQEAAEAMRDAAREALGLQQQFRQEIRDDLAPYRQVGQGALAGGILDRAMQTPTTEGFPNLFDFRSDIGSRIGDQVDTGVSDQDLRQAVFGGLGGLQDVQLSGDPRTGLGDIVAETGDVSGMIEPGSDQWNAIMEDVTREAINPLVARGKSLSGEGIDQVTQAMLRGRGQIENINRSIADRELAQRASDFGISSGQRRQLFGEGFDLGSRRYGEQLGKRGQQVSEQFGEADREFAQLADARNQIFRELFGQEQADIANLMGLDEMRFGQQAQARDQLLREAIGLDQLDFEQLMQLASLGETAAAQTGAGLPSFAATAADVLGGKGLAGAMGERSRYNTAQDLFSLITGLFD